jgi:glycosyltransferase involved in cell wall biosynthesis
MSKRLKVLVSAYACEPQKGSEPGVGWNWVKQIARFHDVWVITRANNKSPIDKALENEPLANVCWIYYDLPKWMSFWKKGQRFVRIYYYIWQIGVYFIGKNIVASNRIDLIHHITFGVYWQSSFLVFHPIPFIFGPVGGAENAPFSFYKTFNIRGKLYEMTRYIIRRLSDYNPFVYALIKRSDLIISKSAETAEYLRKFRKNNILLLTESGIHNIELQLLNSYVYPNSRSIRFVSIGNLLHLKGFHLGLRSFKLFQKSFGHGEYWIIGEGPERNNYENYIKENSLENKITLYGALSRNQVLKNISECDVLIHPSMHDSGGWVCLEAMAAGKPVICLDLGGPAIQVTKETGFKIPAQSPEQVVSDMAEAMFKLASDPQLCKQMGKAGRKRVENHYLWEKKGDYINKIYQDIVSA